MDWNTLWALLQQAGMPGLLIGLLVAVFIYVVDFTDLVNAGWMKRLANVVMSLLFAGVPAGGVAAALTAAISMAFSSLLKFALDALVAYIKAHQTVPASAKAK